MALPTAPTATSIVTEAFSRLNEVNPSASMLARAETILMGVVNRVAKRGNWRVLEETKTIVLTANLPRYALAADYSKGIDLKLYSGGVTGTMQAANAGNITLAADEAITKAAADGAPVFMVTGNAAGYWSHIVDYTLATKVAVISPNWGVTPSSGNYFIPNEELDIPYQFITRPKLIDSIDKPRRMSIYDGELYFSPVPNAGPYVILARYQVKPFMLDLTDARFTTIYWDWREALILGVIRDWAYTPDDDRYQQATKDFEIAVLELKEEEKRRMYF